MDKDILQNALNKLSPDWKNVSSIIPYGCGLEAHRTLKRIRHDFNVPFIVDSDESKWGTKFENIDVVSPEYLNILQHGQKVLVTIAKRRYPEIRNFLEACGLKENRDFCHISQFGMEWYYKYKKEYCIFTMDIAVTTACTLKCRNCNMFIPYHKKPTMYSFEELKDSVDLLFERIDYVFAIGLLGGEALLNKDLGKFIRYLYETYSHKFGSVLVTTNGVIPPKREMIELFRKYGVLVTISDYRDSISDRSQLENIAEELTRMGVVCTIRRDLTWCDFGFPQDPYQVSEDKAREHMLQCDPGWRGLNEGKFYFCNCAWSAEKAGLIQLNHTDYLNLETLPAEQLSTKEHILEYSLGNMEKQYMSFCRVCRGCGQDNTLYVKAGEQVL